METTLRSIIELLDNIFPDYIDSSFESIITVRNTSISLEYNRTFEKNESGYLKWNYAELFDPLKLRWKYYSNNYLKQLNKLTDKTKTEY